LGQWAVSTVNSYRLEDLKNLPSRGPACVMPGSRGMVGRPELGGAQPCPGLPEACPPGGPLDPLVGPWGWPCQEVRVRVAPIRVASRPARSNSSGWRGPLHSGDPPVFRIQTERRSRAVSRGWLSIPPGEGVDSAITGWRPAPCRGRPPITDWLGRVGLGYGRHR
jgi:hypothetical protein